MTRAEYMREWRARGGIESQIARNRAEAVAARWVRENHPDVWKRLIRKARPDRGLNPDQKPGRPRSIPPMDGAA